MDRRIPPEGNRNMLLALHYHEGDLESEAQTRVHVEGCAECREYLAMLAQVEGTLRGWADEMPPAGVWERVQARVARAPRRRPVAVPLPGAAALLALLPAMAAGLALVRLVAAQLATLPFWPWLSQWPGVGFIGSSGVAVLLLLLLGGLGTLALAPPLLLETRKDGRPSLVW
jgi:anti-sigma factor RsiW